MQMDIIILAAENFEIKDEKGVNSGVSIQYIATDNLSPRADGNFRGYRVLKGWLPIALNTKIPRCPAVYSATAEMSVNTKMEAKIRLVDVDYISEVSAKPTGEKTDKKAV